MTDRTELRHTFASAADLYDRMRPRYPDLLFTDLAETARLTGYEMDITYTRAEYLAVLSTYSNHIALTPQQRNGLFACLGSLIDDQFAGAITKRYLFEVSTARKQCPS